MGRRTYQELEEGEKVKRKLLAGIAEAPLILNKSNDADDGVDNLPTRIQSLIKLFNSRSSKSTNMLHFVMYDIESNKVRRLVAKYLLAMGCLRVQKSIFLADLTAEKANKIKIDLAEVQACYDNEDSILILPVPSDYIQAMKIIGKSIDINLITKSTSTLFF